MVQIELVVLFGITRKLKIIINNTYDKLIGRQQEDKVSLLKSKLSNQQSLMAKPTADTKNAAQACFHASNLLSKELKAFSDGKFMKECMDILVENICPEEVHCLLIYRCLGQ